MSMAILRKKDVLRLVKEKNVKFIRLWFTDILGFLKSFAITLRELEGALKEGRGFDGSSIVGFVRIDESDMVAMPDPSTFIILPWRANEQVVAAMFCDILEPDGTPYEGDPWNVMFTKWPKRKEGNVESNPYQETSTKPLILRRRAN